MHIVGTEEYVVLAVFAQGGGSPHAFVRPFHLGSIYHRVVACPVHKVFRRETVDERLAFIFVAPCGIDPVSVVINHTFRIGIPPFEDRIGSEGNRRNYAGGRHYGSYYELT